GNRFFSWITLLSVLGVAIGVASMIVVWSVINGFEDELRRRFLIANAHVLLYRFPSGLENADEWSKTIKNDFPDTVIATAPFVFGETMSRFGSQLHAVQVRGTEPDRPATILDLAPMV